MIWAKHHVEVLEIKVHLSGQQAWLMGGAFVGVDFCCLMSTWTRLGYERCNDARDWEGQETKNTRTLTVARLGE